MEKIHPKFCLLGRQKSGIILVELSVVVEDDEEK